jgi:hypothetical protein
VLGEALLVEGLGGNLDPVLQALFKKEGLGQIDELGNSILVASYMRFTPIVISFWPRK